MGLRSVFVSLVIFIYFLCIAGFGHSLELQQRGELFDRSQRCLNESLPNSILDLSMFSDTNKTYVFVSFFTNH